MFGLLIFGKPKTSSTYFVFLKLIFYISFSFLKILIDFSCILTMSFQLAICNSLLPPLLLTSPCFFYLHMISLILAVGMAIAFWRRVYLAGDFLT